MLNYQGKNGYCETVINRKYGEQGEFFGEIRIFVDSEDFGGEPTMVIDVQHMKDESSREGYWVPREVRLFCLVELVRRLGIKVLTLLDEDNSVYEEPEKKFVEMCEVIKKMLA